MKKIIINGKGIKVKASVGAVKTILSKYDPAGLDKLNEAEQIDFTINLIWAFITPGFFGFKPYITKKRFMNKVDIYDIRNSQNVLISMLYGIDELDEAQIKTGKKK